MRRVCAAQRRSSAPITRGPTRWTATCAAAGLQGRRGFDDTRWGLVELPVTDWHGLIFVDGSGPAAAAEPSRWPRSTSSSRRTSRSGWSSPGGTLRRRRELEDPDRELPRVLPLPDDPPGAVQGQPAQERRELPSARALGRRLDGPARRAWTPCRWTGPATACRCAAWMTTGLRTVIYVNIFPNVLLSLHPDYVMTHRLVPLAADRTLIECTWAFAPESLAAARLRPRLRGRVLGHHQPAGLARMRVGAARPQLRRTPCRGRCRRTRTRSTSSSPMVARGYPGQPVWNPAVPSGAPADAVAAQA